MYDLILEFVSSQADDIELVNWQRLAGAWGIRIFTKDGELHRCLPTGIPKRLSEVIEPQQSRLYPAIPFIIALLSLWPQKVCWLQGGREREDCQSLHQQVPA